MAFKKNVPADFTRPLALARGTPLWLPFLLTLLLMGAASNCPAADAVFKVGASKRDITPAEPVPMWGYGARHDALSKGVLDPLYAAAVVIQAGDNKLAIVGLDLGRSPSEKSLVLIRQRIKEQCGIQHSFIAGSHTHHGPVLELSNAEGRGKGKFEAALRYYKQLEDGITAAIVEADKNLAPAKVAAGATQLDGFNRNRHSKIEPKPVDRTLGVLRFDNADTGKAIATVVNFAGHPTTIPAQTLKFSADWPGAMKSEVEKQLGGMAVFMQGASGDLSINKGVNPDHIAYGQSLGREVVKLANSLTPTQPKQPAITAREERFRFDSRVDLTNPLIRQMYSAGFFSELIANFADEYAEGIRPRITVTLLNGEIALVGASGEFFCQHANRLRERARVGQLFFFGYCNGYHQYFPTIEAAAEGGYGADAQVAPVPVGAGEQLANAALIWLFQMKGK